jgi:hypothetical protein
VKLKRITTFLKGPRTKLEIKRIRTKLKITIFGKLGLNDEIKKNKTFTKRPRINIWNQKNKD